MLSVYTWTGMIDDDSTKMGNWMVLVEMIPGQPPPPPPGLPDGNDDLFFNSLAVKDANGYSRDCENLTSLSDSFNSIHIQDGFNGTVVFGEALSLGAFELASGAIAQSDATKDLSVLGNFNWTGGTLNNTPSLATVNIYGGGSITLPGEGNTITAGSTLNFDNLNPGTGTETLTTIDGLGTLLLNGLSDDGIFVRQDAKVARVVQIGTPGAAASGIEGGGKQLTLLPGAGWGYIGAGTTKENLRVANYGGLFTLGTNAPFGGVNFGAAGRSQVTVQLTGGNANASAYGQDLLQAPFVPMLQLMSGCVLDVGTSQATIKNGFVWIIGNTDLGAAAQVATVKGTYAMTGGSLGFPETIQIQNMTAWGEFKVDGNVTWSGGDYVPGLNAALNNNDEANHWIVTGTMTVDATKPVKPRIVPTPQQEPPNVQVLGTWEVILTEGQNASLQGEPLLPQGQGWTLVTDSVNGVKKKWSVKR